MQTVQPSFLTLPGMKTPQVESIDPEEPEFVSPSHIILAQIQLQVTTTSSTDGASTSYDAVHFTSTVHVRYPKPCTTDLDPITTTLFRHVMMAPPILTLGYVNANESSPVQLVIVTEPDVTLHHFNMYNSQEKSSSLLQLWIACGDQSHFSIIFLVTILVALIGSIHMCYDIASIVVP
jgi:PIG-X / PBN1